MGAHSRTTFQKRQKELARMERQRDKAARKAQRKLEAQANREAGLVDEFGEVEHAEPESEDEAPSPSGEAE